MGEGVETRAKQDVLCHPRSYRLRKLVFSVAAARHEVRSQCDREGTLLLARSWIGRSAKLRLTLRAENANRERIVEDDGRVIDLVRGPAQSNAHGGAGWNGFLHGTRLLEGGGMGRGERNRSDSSASRRMTRFGNRGRPAHHVRRGTMNGAQGLLDAG